MFSAHAIVASGAARYEDQGYDVFTDLFIMGGQGRDAERDAVSEAYSDYSQDGFEDSSVFKAHRAFQETRRPQPEDYKQSEDELSDRSELQNAEEVDQRGFG